MEKKVRKDIIYPELSYKIVGCFFEVYKSIGSNHREKYYQNALKSEFINRKIKFEEQVYFPLKYKGSVVGKNYLDFLVENKIVVEIKVGTYFKKQHLNQVLEYLKSCKLKLGIIAIFTNNGVKYYRVVNLK
jgi:GxxExxY protein